MSLNLTLAGMVPSADPRDLTQAYVEAAIARYERDGLDATVAYYNSEESVEGERSMMILQAGDQTVLAFVRFPQFIGSNMFFRAQYSSRAVPSRRRLKRGHWF